MSDTTTKRFDQLPITEHYKVIRVVLNTLYCDHCSKTFYTSPNASISLMEANNASTTHANNGAG